MTRTAETPTPAEVIELVHEVRRLRDVIAGRREKNWPVRSERAKLDALERRLTRLVQTDPLASVLVRAQEAIAGLDDLGQMIVQVWRLADDDAAVGAEATALEAERLSRVIPLLAAGIRALEAGDERRSIWRRVLREWKRRLAELRTTDGEVD